MVPVENRKPLVAIDLGAQSCRVSLLRWNRGEPEIEVVHRFANAPSATSSGLRWNIERVFQEIKFGLRICATNASEGIASIAIDGWAVDYVRLDEHGEAAEDPFCYRDERTRKAEQEVHAILSPARLYSLTGIQILRINTLYQLYADKLMGMDTRRPWLNLPEYMTYKLGGRRVSEYTNATHTGLVRLGTHDWCEQIFRELGLDLGAAPEIVPSGSIVGGMAGDLAELPAFSDTRLVAAACHDTACAIAAIPVDGDDWAFISSGTWSLVGTVLGTPCVSEVARRLNFTNLGGVGGETYFLKNVNGMWLLQRCMDEWEQQGSELTLQQLIAACDLLPRPNTLIDVDDPELMVPGNILAKINTQLQRSGQQDFGGDEKRILFVANTVFHSLAARYAEVLASIGTVTNKKLRRLYIVGGGSQNTLLNRLTAERTGLEILLGSTESTTIGNFAVQLAALEDDRNSSRGVSAASVAGYARKLTSTFERPPRMCE
jgi:rhamnulokinase